MNLWKLVSTFFLIVKIPIAPGSFASLVCLLIWFFLPVSVLIQLIVISGIFIIGVLSSNKMVIEMNNSDPSEVVIDEIAGMSIALFLLPHSILLYFIAFILFRIFDIFKPSFIYKVQSLPGGWGIMMDDVLAGIMTWAICQGINTII